MAGPPAPSPASTPGSSPPSHRRSARLGRRPGGDHHHPQSTSPSPAHTPPPPPHQDASVSPGGIALRRSVRIRGFPLAAPSSSRRQHVPIKTPSSSRRKHVPLNAPSSPRRTLQEAVEQWSKAKAESGADEENCVLPFLEKGAPRKVECLICSTNILPEERTQCSAHNCTVTLHKVCYENGDGICPRHICFYCKRRTSFHRLKNIMPACTRCSLKQNRMVDSVDPSNTMISWSIWPSTSEDAVPKDDIEEVFRRLPLPYTDQEFNINPINKEELESVTKPPPYVHLKRNVYFVKKKCVGDPIVSECTDCFPPYTCEIRCSCRSVCVSCSRACHCSGNCTNRPFRREKRVDIVKTQNCGWGAIALETIEKGDFVIEFVGEVIDRVTCEERLKDMKTREDKRFYMCKVSNDFVIDATFRGNACRFLNHSCKPNCLLENWQVNGKTRLGVFASQAIEVGEPLTYNYRFKQHFGPQIECYCGAVNCNGNL